MVGKSCSLDATGALEPNVLDLLRESDDSGQQSPGGWEDPRRDRRRARRTRSCLLPGERGNRARAATPPPDYDSRPGGTGRGWWRRLLDRLRGRTTKD